MAILRQVGQIEKQCERPGNRGRLSEIEIPDRFIQCLECIVVPTSGLFGQLPDVFLCLEQVHSFLLTDHPAQDLPKLADFLPERPVIYF